MIRRFKLVRIDPRFLISVCFGDIHDRNGNILYHRHMSHVATVENDPNTPVRQIELRSVQNGLLLPVPCIYARDLVHTPTFTSIDQQFLSINLPTIAGELVRGIKVPVTKKRKSQTYSKASKASTDKVETPAKKKKAEQIGCVNASTDASFDEFLRDQPSTSSNRYNISVEREITARKRLKSKKL